MVIRAISEMADSISIWPPLTEPDPSVILKGREEEVNVLEALVEMVASQRFEDRKNKLPHLVHPLSVTHYLKRANSSFLAQCAGVLHDYVEELVDSQAKRMGLVPSPDCFEFFDALEEQLLVGLEGDLANVFSTNSISGADPLNITETVGLLTRHKRHFYYESIHGIFTCDNPVIRDAAIEVKLADRKHNGLTLDNFGNQAAVYQCFKNLFILNEAKKHLRRTGRLSGPSSSVEMSSMEKLFRKSGKATYDALWYVAEGTKAQVTPHAILTLEQAFQKFDKMYGGLGEVTAPNPKELHPLRLFQGVVLKYDDHLHKRGREYEKRNARERLYCSQLFSSSQFSEEQIEALVAFKDAFALKVVVGNLLYKQDYHIEGFGVLPEI
mgnify:CR=1 FL=1